MTRYRSDKIALIGQILLLRSKLWGIPEESLADCKAAIGVLMPLGVRNLRKVRNVLRGVRAPQPDDCGDLLSFRDAVWLALCSDMIKDGVRF